MVIGVLALLAIIAIVYASMGQSDRRSSGAYVRSNQIEDISGQMGNYIAGIIGADVHQVVTDRYPRQGSNYQVRRFRAHWTYPSVEINDEVRSTITGNNGVMYDPVGGSRVVGNNASLEANTGYQPWLAPAEPTWIRFNESDNWEDENRQYLNFNDWLTISNVAPDGRFVNLANLRNNFGAEPGEGNDTNGRPRLSEGLVLFEDNGDAYTPGSSQTVDGRPADYDIPWHWTALQQNAARPIKNTAAGTGLARPGDSDYLLNQWADADGDGIADARWSQMIGPGGTTADFSIPGLAVQDNARYFVATRVVDMTGMANISTGTDLIDPPGPLTPANTPPEFPFGRTGADIDILRALTLADIYQRYEDAQAPPPGAGIVGGYALIQQPVDLAAAPSAGNFKNYLNEPGNYAAREIGESAYAALQRAVGVSRLPDGAAPAAAGLVPDLNPDITFQIPATISSKKRAEFYAAAQADPTNVGYSNSSIYNTNQRGTSTRSIFGMTEALELHAFFGVNDPRQLSRLESVVEGRRIDGSTSYPTYGPLRSTRGLEVERERRGDRRADGMQDDDSLAQQHFDIRHRVTTISGSRPLTTLAPLRTFDPAVIGDDEVRVNLTPFLYPPDGNRISESSLKRLFNHIADALMPYRATDATEVGIFNPQAAGGVKYRGLYYGQSFDFSMRAAAHLLVNLIDAADDDNDADLDIAGPTAITLRTDRTAPAESSPRFPWAPVTLDNANIELANVRNVVESRLVNIYGIEAQPFLIEAASYGFWTDVPYNARNEGGGFIGADNEYEQREPDPDGPGPGEGQLAPITINHEVSTTNHDFLGEIVAFQMTNPFSHDVYLTRAGSAGPDFLYYVQYAGRYFPLAEMSQTDGNAPTFLNADLVLKAGETRVFFATSPRTKFRFNARFRVPTTSPTAFPPPGLPPDYEFLRNWIERQFAVIPRPANQGEPVHTTMFDPTTFVLIEPDGNTEDGLMDLHGVDIGITTEDRREIRLWRVMRSGSYDPPGFNDRENDLLADRLRDPAGPGTATMFQRLESEADDEVPGTLAGPDNGTVFGGQSPEDNTGFSITLWGAIRRPTNPTDPTDLNAEAPLGAMPPWTMEARSDSIYGWNGPTQPVVGSFNAGNLNAEETGPSGRGDQGDYGGGDTRYTRFAALLADQAAGDGGLKINAEIRDTAEDKKGNALPLSPSTGDGTTFRPFNQQAIRIALSGRDAGGGTVVNPGMFKRVGDVLLPLAIGPFHDPDHPRPGVNNELTRMTLSEAIALATDYYSPPDTSIYYLAGHDGATNGRRPKLDQGHLVLDDYVPYRDMNTNGVFDPGPGNEKERPLGLGIPMALNLLDKFRFDDFGNKANSEIGKVSINTSTLLTNSLLPLLAPDPLTDWLTEDETTPVERNAVYNLGVEQYDVAATLQAYRDRVDVRTRPKMDANGVAAPAGSTLEISFRDTTTHPLIEHWEQDGRRDRAQILGIREERGFRSVGEVMAARLRTIPAGVDPVEYRSNSIDKFALDEESFTGQFGIEPHNIKSSTAIPVTEGSDEVVDDYGEKLAIANAVLNTITVRSDVFCVWFIIHGYLPGDVENLSPRDPMIPSIARRYMMIVDRSNVVRQGDKPRILLFNEVPL